MKKVVVAGASGLIGSKLLSILLYSNEIESVTALVRSLLPVNHLKLKQIITDFDALDFIKPEITGDVLYCCLGTTKSKIPNRTTYKKIDQYYPVHLAKIGIENGFQQYHLVSALGANSQSYIFYNKIKGETEEKIKQLKFKSIHIFQPSLLAGDRQESRPFEKIAIKIVGFINPLLVGNYKKYQSIKPEVIATAMLNQTTKDLEGIYVYPSDKIKQLA